MKIVNKKTLKCQLSLLWLLVSLCSFTVFAQNTNFVGYLVGEGTVTSSYYDSEASSGLGGSGGNGGKTTAQMKTQSTYVGWDFENIWEITSGSYPTLLKQPTVTFNANGVTGFPISSITEGRKLESLPTPERTGYTFNGWFMQETGGTKVTTSTVFPANTTIYAQWTPIPYTITYNLDGGTVASNPTSYTIETATLTLNNPTKSGYTFSGWTGSNGTAPQTDVSIAKGSTGDKSYTANWTLITYNITYDLNNGTVETDNPVSYTIETAAFTLNNPTRIGYTFAGWTGSNGTAPQTSVSVEHGSTGNKSYTANWELITYTVTFNANGGSVTPEIGITGTGWKLSSLPTPTRNGYTFNGWFTAETEGTEVTTSTVFSANITIYAQWTPETYTITYTLNDGTVASNPTSYTIETATLTLNNPTKSGYTFSGWTGSNGTTPQTDVSIAKGSTGDKSYTANWELITYNITYDLNNGTVETGNPASYTIETAAFTLNNPTRTGYTFAGWTGSNSTAPQTSVSVEHGSTGNKSYTANWTLITYTVTFDPTGGTVSPTFGTTGEGWKLASLPTPTKSDSVFKDWYTDLTWSTRVTTNTVFEEDATIFARWEDRFNYAVTFDANGGSVTPDSRLTDKNDKLDYLPTPERAGYTFNGWFTAETGGTKVTTDTEFYDYTTIYAQWTLETYTITYNLDGGTVASDNPTNYTIETATFTLNNPTKYGYTFAGWTGSDYLTLLPTVSIESGSTGDKSYTANWTPITYTVTYNAGTGVTGVTVPPSQTKNYGASLTLSSTTPTRTGYAFNGWNTAANGTGTAYAAGENYTANAALTLYAQWAAVYTVTYSGNGNTGGSAPDAQTQASAGQALTLSGAGALVKTGYTFDGWNTAANGSGTSYAAGASYTPAGNVTLYAKWKANTYAVTYNANNGTGAPANQTKNYGASLTLSSTTPTRTGYTFNGWNTTAGGTGTAYAAGENYTANAALTLYAQWTPETYTITYTLNYGTVATANPASYNIETATFTLNNPTRTGYTFAGWTGSNGSTAQTTVTIAKGSTGDKTYTATWTPASYTITYNLNGGTATNPATYTVETSAITLNNPTRSGYTFAGWTGSNGTAAQTTVTIAKGSTGDKTYTATWTPASYTITYNLNDGTVATANPASYNIETATFTLNNPTRTGYTFAGWTGSNGTAAQTTVSIEQGSRGNKTYAANWTPVSYTITYTLNDGTVATANPASYNIETATFTLNNPTRTGYTFAGWTGSNGTAAQTTVTIAKGSTGNKTYAATWTPASYTITYNLNDGTVATTNPASYNIETATFTLNNPTRTGYTFAGWTGSNGTAAQTTVTIAKGSTGNKTYAATWTPASYTITYNLNGGTATNPATYTVETSAITLNNPTRSGYTFAGWTGSNGTAAQTTVTIAKGSTGDKTYTATWTPASYTITFNANGGTVTPASGTTGEGQKLASLPTPTREGYTFKGWFTTSTGSEKVEESKVYSANTTIYAQWTANTYTVTYNVNGGSGAPSPSTRTKTHDVALTISSTKPTRTGYTFAGWNTASDGTGTSYASGASYTANASVTLYAQWIQSSSSSSSSGAGSNSSSSVGGSSSSSVGSSSNSSSVGSSSSSETPSSSSSETPSSSSSETLSSSSSETPSSSSSSIPNSTPIIGNTIVLENLPSNMKIEVYNLQGKLVYSAYPENLKILKIGVQTKGVYIVKAGSQSVRAVVK
ncbi:hypothetical protein R83H12_02934 [Fibrobacteria bacterium R8-3-H12]